MHLKLKRNIPLIYLITSLNYSWFWVAIWVLFYLRFTNFAGIGILESAMIVTAILGGILLIFTSMSFFYKRSLH